MMFFIASAEAADNYQGKKAFTIITKLWLHMISTNIKSSVIIK